MQPSIKHMKLYILSKENMSLAYMQSYKVQLLKVFFFLVIFFIKGTHFLQNEPVPESW